MVDKNAVMQIWYTSGGIVVKDADLERVFKILDENGVNQIYLEKLSGGEWSITKPAQ